MTNTYSDTRVVKIFLFIQGSLLLLATIFSYISDYQQGIIDHRVTKVTSRFLEIIQQENSISDSRLEFIEMIILKDHLKLTDSQLASFDNDLETILGRYNKKLGTYNPSGYREFSSSTESIITNSEQKRVWFKSLSLVFTIIAFFINICSIWKISKFPLQNNL